MKFRNKKIRAGTIPPIGKWSVRIRSSRGANLVEMAMIVPLLLLLTFAMLDFSTVLYVYLSLENGISQATRYGVTGQQMDDPAHPGNLLSREDSIKKAMQDATPTLVIDDTGYTFQHLAVGGSTWLAGSGGPNEITKVSLNYRWSFFTPLLKPFFNNGQINLRVTSTMKNESFTAS
jgi:Flp pilus assembly protein TadG